MVDYPLDSLLSFDSEEALKKAFGKHVKKSVGYYPEGMGEYVNTIIFPDSKNQVEFVWEGNNNGTFSGNYLTQWRLKNGNWFIENNMTHKEYYCYYRKLYCLSISFILLL